MKLPQKCSAFVARSRQARVSRYGFSLIEMTAVATLSALLLAVAVTVLIKLDKQDDQIGLRYRQTSDLTRLADQFRTDVHASNVVDSSRNDQPAGVVVICRIPDGSRVEYRQIKQHLVRIERDSHGEERQDRYLFSPQASFRLERQSSAIAEGTPPEPIISQRDQLVKLVVRWPMNGNQYDAMRQLAIAAQIGRDLPVRLVKAESNDAAP